MAARCKKLQEETLTRIIREAKSQSKNKKGRPRKRWKEQVEITAI